MLETIIITNALILLDSGQTLSSGFITLANGLIDRIGPMAELGEYPPEVQIIDGRDHLVMPGLVNCHNHCPMTLFRGLADDLPLMIWLQEHIFPAEARMVSAEMVYHCTMLAAAEMIRSGTTTVADSYFFEERVAQALADAGMRAVAAQGVIDFPAPGVPDPSKNVATAATFIDQWQGHPLITPAVFCHSPYTCSAETLIQAKEMARDKQCRFFIHVAETEEEVQNSIELHGKTPLGYLDQLGVLDDRTICIHGVWFKEEDLKLMQKTGAAVVTCPESNMKLASGVAPLTEMIKAGIPVGLGTDGCASNNNLDLFGEMDMAAKLHKVISRDPTTMPAVNMVTMATSGGAGALGLPTGRLAPGRAADVIMLDLSAPHLSPRYDIPSLLTYSASGGDVSHVIINGRLVMADRKLLTIDLQETIKQVNLLAQTIRATL
ncbi:MAG: amidohydrolase [Proteobacteria bacterium]|nr:amidohydrolase [Pseudomonadota bacterium]MBU1686992.1 amidohydrolase [Pseudomonadota bacterium]